MVSWRKWGLTPEPQLRRLPVTQTSPQGQSPVC